MYSESVQERQRVNSVIEKIMTMPAQEKKDR